MPPIASQRHLFDIPEEVAYFNCAYNSPQLKTSTQRLQQGALAKRHPWARTAEDFFQDAETIRSLAGQLLGGRADNYAIIPSASYGLSTAARILEPRLKPGDRLLVVEEAFPSNYLPWQRAAQESGAILETVATPRQGGWTQAILAQIRPGVKLVAVPNCHWVNGALIHLEAIGQACRKAGAVLAVDATQSLGAMPLNLDAVQPDFVVASGYKWLLSPYGFSLMYVAEKWWDERPLEESWLGRDNAKDFTALVRYSSRYMPGARRFDVGQKCTATLLPGAIAALEQLNGWGVAPIALSLAAINRKIAERLETLGCQLPAVDERCPHMMGITLQPQFKGRLVSDLAQRNIYLSQRGNALRFAPHLHVTENDVERLLAALEILLKPDGQG